MSVRRLVLALGCIAAVAVVPARATDEPDEEMPGRVVIIKPSSPLVKFVSKAATEFALPGATNDPTVEGATLVIFDTGGTESDTYALPPVNWRALGTPVQGYKYRGTGSSGDPCRLVLVKKRVVRATCRGSSVNLTTPFAGPVGIVLTVGTDSKRYCASFGGTQATNDATLLKRSDAPAAPCPAPPSCPSPGASCGSCATGFCTAHIDPDPPTNICADTAVCTAGPCTNDAECPTGQSCVQNPFPPGNIACCSSCP